MKKQHKHIGSSLDDFLKEEGIFDDSDAVAVKRVLAWELQRTMQQEQISKIEMAKRLETSRSQLDRLLDPKNTAVTLATLQKAAHCLGKHLKLELR